MKEICLDKIDSMRYQPNIVIAILLALYSKVNNTLIISKMNLGANEQYFNSFIETLINTIKISNYPLIDKVEDSDTVTLKVEGTRFDIKSEREILYKQTLTEYLTKYIEYFRQDMLSDDIRNMPSWETYATNFINDIDTTCNLNNYKMFTLEHIQPIAYYVIKNKLYLNEIDILPNLTANADILEDSSWTIKLVLSLKNFIKSLAKKEAIEEELKTKKKLKYSARELKLINYINEHMDYDYCRIAPEEALEVISPDRASHPQIYNKSDSRKFVSNFIHRLNKKYEYNTGHKLIVSKEFKDCYIIPNPNGEFGES